MKSFHDERRYQFSFPLQKISTTKEKKNIKNKNNNLFNVNDKVVAAFASQLGNLKALSSSSSSSSSPNTHSLSSTSINFENNCVQVKIVSNSNQKIKLSESKSDKAKVAPASTKYHIGIGKAKQSNSGKSIDDDQTSRDKKSSVSVKNLEQLKTSTHLIDIAGDDKRNVKEAVGKDSLYLRDSLFIDVSALLEENTNSHIKTSNRKCPPVQHKNTSNAHKDAALLNDCINAWKQYKDGALQPFLDQTSTNPVFKVLMPTVTASSTSSSSGSAEGMVLAVFKEECKEMDVKRNGLMREEVLLRERAAFILDSNSKGLSNVPPTLLVKVSNNRQGSLQRFVENIGSCDERPDYLNKVDAEQVHKIGILDIRMFNTDRHGGNILITKAKEEASSNVHDSEEMDVQTIKNSLDIDVEDGNGMEMEMDSISTSEKLQLIPIDHSLSLPSIYTLSDAYFDWTYYDAANIPFSKNTISHIQNNINITQDQASLRDLGIREECIATNTACTMLLQSAISIDPTLTLADFGRILQRPYPPGHELFHQHWSPFEHMVNEAFHEVGDARIVNNKENRLPTKLNQQQQTHQPISSIFFEALDRIIRRGIQSGEWRKLAMV